MIPTYQNGGTVDTQRLYADILRAGLVLLKNLDPSSSEVILHMAGRLGSLNVGIDEELLGPTVMELRYDPSKIKDGAKAAYFTANEFPLHTDVSYVPVPPRLMLMHCVHASPDGGGVTRISNCKAAFESLGAADRCRLEAPICRFIYPPNCKLGESEPLPIHAAGMWRFKFDSMRFPDDMTGTIQRFNQALNRFAQHLMLERGDLLIVDNHRIAHGRTAFQPGGPNMQERTLLRTYASLTKVPE